MYLTAKNTYTINRPSTVHILKDTVLRDVATLHEDSLCRCNLIERSVAIALFKYGTESDWSPVNMGDYRSMHIYHHAVRPSGLHSRAEQAWAEDNPRYMLTISVVAASGSTTY